MTAPKTPEQAADAVVEAYRLSLPLTDPYRHDLESPLHEDACAHMAPGCPCTPPNDTPEDAS